MDTTKIKNTLEELIQYYDTFDYEEAGLGFFKIETECECGEGSAFTIEMGSIAHGVLQGATLPIVFSKRAHSTLLSICLTAIDELEIEQELTLGEFKEVADSYVKLNSENFNLKEYISELEEELKIEREYCKHEESFYKDSFGGAPDEEPETSLVEDDGSSFPDILDWVEALLSTTNNSNPKEMELVIKTFPVMVFRDDHSQLGDPPEETSWSTLQRLIDTNENSLIMVMSSIKGDHKISLLRDFMTKPFGIEKYDLILIKEVVYREK